uniref:Uncharacterized protein n=1 Tax=uncultured alpha proteobacterium HF0070_34A12 TaxID=710806 RepID=E0XXH0_9PROT|nr:hypothetical protein [uncultured alpha proteobacterium HF0070_34A12]
MDLSAWTLALGPGFNGRGSGFRQDINTSIYNRLSATPAKAEHDTLPKSGNERGNNSENKKAASDMRRLEH